MIINPEFEAASEIARVLYMPTALEIGTFAHGQAEMIKIKVPEGNQMCGHTLAEISRLHHLRFLYAQLRGMERCSFHQDILL